MKPFLKKLGCFIYLAVILALGALFGWAVISPHPEWTLPTKVIASGGSGCVIIVVLCVVSIIAYIPTHKYQPPEPKR